MNNSLSYIFIFFGIIVLLSALFVLFSKSVIHAAFMLLLCFLSIAAVFVLAQADFLAVSQIMIYVGGILILLVFGVLLTNKSETDRQSGSTNIIKTENYNTFLGVIIVLSVFSGLIFIYSKIPFTKLEGRHFETQSIQKSNVNQIGIQLLTNNYLALESIGILLLIALITAGFISKKSINSDN
jgi:NADH-quinone oxidoreductase subunit J